MAGWVCAHAFTPPADILEAKELCDKGDLQAVEGLWLYPEDEVTVLIYRETGQKGTYGIYVVESADCSLNPGDRIGSLQASPDPDKFKMKLYTAMKKGVPGVPCNASARLSRNHESITVTKPSLKLRFQPNRLLPYFWRIVNVSIKNPESVPEGMIKIYPSYDGNDSSRRETRYL